MRIIVITLLPEMFNALMDYGVLSRIFSAQKVSLEFINPRDFVSDVHKTIDDRPFGGGPGMLMLAEPLAKSIELAKQKCPQAPVIYLSPQGEVFDQRRAEELSKNLIENSLNTHAGLIFICGRYEGIDQRVLDCLVDREISLGDFVLTGGELALMCILDAVLRLIPGVLGDSESALQDSFSNSEGLLDCPHYTRPLIWRGLSVPEILLSGHHEKIKKWRHEKALEITEIKRPDIFKKFLEKIKNK